MSIDFEQDQQNTIQKTGGIQSLADQVERLEGLQNYSSNDFLLLTGDPAIIGVACSIVSDMTNGKFNLLKWDKQERKYYPIQINLHEKGEIND